MRHISLLTMASLLVLQPIGAIADPATKASIEGAGRNIMRTADGGLVATYAKPKGPSAALVLRTSMDNGRSWQETEVQSPGRVIQTAIDSNFQGSYIAFTEKVGGSTVGRVAYAANPFGADRRIVVSSPLTLDSIAPVDVFIQASRKGWGDKADRDQETVVYGWQDAKTKALYVGVSPDGKTFPAAKKIVSDPHAVSGPAVAIRGKFVIASYLTRDPAIAPVDVPADVRLNAAYPAWTESFDGGQTWSAPLPLIGKQATDFPQVAVDRGQSAAPVKDSASVLLAGGTTEPMNPILNWNISEKGRAEIASAGGTTFIQTSMARIDDKGRRLGEVGIVSFKESEPNSKWTHVVANNGLTADPGRVAAAISSEKALTSQFQYTALIDTPVRATTYSEVDPSSGMSRLVVAVSTDTGKTFDRHISFSTQELVNRGLPAFDSASVFTASQCLYEDRDGNVHVDLMVHKKGTLEYARLPIGVSAADLRRQTVAQASTSGAVARQ